jgi:hypothetical protein
VSLFDPEFTQRLKQQVSTMEGELRNVYRQYHTVVALLASVFHSSVAPGDTPGASAVTVDTPAGPLTWNVPGEHMGLFEHIDPHGPAVMPQPISTDERDQRVRDLTTAYAASGATPPLAWQDQAAPPDPQSPAAAAPENPVPVKEG